MKLDDLTEEEIRELEPGQGLDDLVAREVMGWKVNRIGMAMTADGELVQSWRPSTDIASAWRVVDRLRENPFDTMSVTYAAGEFGFSMEVAGVDEVEFVAKRATHAISIAALIAKKRGLIG